MASYIVTFLSQKGGVGKSSLARALACEVARKGTKVRLVDVNSKQQTALKWSQKRSNNNHQPDIDVAVCKNIKDALGLAHGVDLLIIDMPGEASSDALIAGEYSDLVIQSGGYSLDDLEPMVHLFHEMLANRIDRSKLLFVPYKLDGKPKLAKADFADIKSYVENAGFRCLDAYVRDLRCYIKAQNDGLAICEVPFLEPRNESLKLVHKLVDLLLSQSDE